MAQSDLLTKRSVMNVLHQLFAKYKMAFKPEGDEDVFGFCAEVPKTIESMSPEYDVDTVIESIQSGQSLNIPNYGYCMNKDLAIQIIRSGLDGVDTSYDKPATLSDDLDKAIAFLSLKSFCHEDCAGKNCINCNRYKAKKNAMIGLNFYRKAEDLLTRIAYLKTHANSDEGRRCYAEVEEMLQEAYNYANDRTNLF